MPNIAKKLKPKIIKRLCMGKPYYEIRYYNVFDKSIHVGYGSYDKRNVKQWLHDEFVIVSKADLSFFKIAKGTDVQEVRHSKWIEVDRDVMGISTYECLNCHNRTGEEKANFCPNCGAKMDGEEGETNGR